jgi:hypothetical protein
MVSVELTLVAVELRLTEVGFIEQVISTEAGGVQVKVTAPPNPPLPTAVIVEVPDFPMEIVKEDGLGFVNL